MFHAIVKASMGNAGNTFVEDMATYVPPPRFKAEDPTAPATQQ